MAMVTLGAVVVVIAVSAGWHGVSRMRRGLRQAASLELVRGIRALVSAAAAAVLALALVTGEQGLLAFVAVFLAEELYETGVLLLVLRAAQSPDAPAA